MSKPPAWLRIDLSDLLLEIISIVIAIVLAFALNSWNQSRQGHDEARESLVNIRREVAANRARLIAVMPMHERFRVSTRAYIASHRNISVDQFYGALTVGLPHGYNPFQGEDTAWTIARSLPSIVLIPYDLRVTIERMYATQSTLDVFEIRVVQDFHLESAQADPNLYLPAISLSIDAADVTALEQQLLGEYDDVLRQIQASHVPS